MIRRAAAGSASAARSACELGGDLVADRDHVGRRLGRPAGAAAPAPTRSATNRTSSAKPDSALSARSLFFTASARSDDDTAMHRGRRPAGGPRSAP